MPETLNNNAEHEKNNAEPTEWDSMKKIKFDPEKASRLKLASAGNSFGEGRDDRNASVAPPEGEFSRTSAITTAMLCNSARYMVFIKQQTHTVSDVC